MITSKKPADPGTDLQELKTLLAVERSERQRLQKILTLRDRAQDAATSFFMILHASTARDWRIIYVNRALAQAHGYGPAELMGRSPAMLLDRDVNREALERIAEAVTEVRAVSVELTARRAQNWASEFLPGALEAIGGSAWAHPQQLACLESRTLQRPGLSRRYDDLDLL